MVRIDAARFETDLIDGRLGCPACGSRFRPWGHGIEREVRLVGGSERRRLRRSDLSGLRCDPTEAFGRFEAAAPGDLSTGDALHGPTTAVRTTYVFAFIDDHSRGPGGRHESRDETMSSVVDRDSGATVACDVADSSVTPMPD